MFGPEFEKQARFMLRVAITAAVIAGAIIGGGPCLADLLTLCLPCHAQGEHSRPLCGSSRGGLSNSCPITN